MNAVLDSKHFNDASAVELSIRPDIVNDLEDLAQGLSLFSQRLSESRSIGSLLETLMKLRVWMRDKPVLGRLLERQLETIACAQCQEPFSEFNLRLGLRHLAEQLAFFAMVFEQESCMVNQWMPQQEWLIYAD